MMHGDSCLAESGRDIALLFKPVPYPSVLIRRELNVDPPEVLSSQSLRTAADRLLFSFS